MNDFHEYVGSIHIHSTYSDGSRPIPQIIDLAQEAGLDYIIISDHYTLQPLRDGLEDWHDNLLTLIGYETADPKNNNHFLIFGLNNEVNQGLISASKYVSLVKEKGGYGFIAHPDEVRTHPKHRPYPWNYWETQDFIGIEIWNYMSVWVEALNKFNGLFNFLLPDSVVRHAPSKTLERLDKLNKERLVPAIGGIDVHEKHHRVLGLFTVKIFPYIKLFQRIRTHILSQEKFTKNLEKDKEKVYNCIISGSSFVSNYYRGDAKGFRFYAFDGREKHSMGSRIQYNNQKIKITVKTPLKCIIRLLKDGQIIGEAKGVEYSHQVKDKGVYRVETYRRGGAWVYSNPITVL